MYWGDGHDDIDQVHMFATGVKTKLGRVTDGFVLD